MTYDANYVIYNNDEFFTDANGRQMIKRKLNSRSFDFPDGDEEPVASNYYPITSGMTFYINYEHNS